MDILKVENLHKSFGQLEVLSGVDFAMKKGEVLSIIGSSGSGKTTLLRCLNFLEEPTSGTILVDNETLFSSSSQNQNKKISIREQIRRQKNFGLVFQSFNLFPQYNVLDNITLAMNLHSKKDINEKVKNKEIARKEKREKYLEEKKKNTEKAYKIIEMMGLMDKVSSYPCEISGGQQQRVAIARALALEPKILCFDEPTSALDPELTQEVLKAINRLKSLGITMIIVTHEMEFAKNISDKVIFMHNGKIEEMGTPQEVFENPKSKAIKSFLMYE